MQKNKLNILSTRPLSEEIIQEALKQDVSIDCLSFIETEPIKTPELKEKIQQLSGQNIITVFTSMNAVEAVKEYLTSKTSWKIFSIGQTTKELIEDFFGKENIAGTADDAGLLADVIIHQHPKEVVFFCGDQRRDELPGKLIANNIIVEEIIVYRTIATWQKTEKHYDGILFFSPSAVQSFFSTNTIDNSTIVFAIGNTTANAVKKQGNNQIVVADKPGKEELVKKMLEHFSKEKQRIDE
jgi:uroporphyrinogen-III synthase